MIRPLGQYVPRRPHRLNGPFVAMMLNGLHDFHRGRVFVLEVGAGRGEGKLPLRQRLTDDGWSGLLIEPHPANFAALEALHAESDRVAVLNLGISDVSANLPLHALTDEGAGRNRRLPPHRASLIRDRIAAPDADVEAVEVPFLRMDAVLGELGIDSAALVVINAGGHEEQVLRSFDIARLDPSLLLLDITPDTLAETNAVAILTEAQLLPFRIGNWLVGLAPDRLAVPLEEILTFFRRGIGAGDAAEEAEE